MTELEHQQQIQRLILTLDIPEQQAASYLRRAWQLTETTALRREVGVDLFWHNILRGMDPEEALENAARGVDLLVAIQKGVIEASVARLCAQIEAWGLFDHFHAGGVSHTGGVFHTGGVVGGNRV